MNLNEEDVAVAAYVFGTNFPDKTHGLVLNLLFLYVKLLCQICTNYEL